MNDVAEFKTDTVAVNFTVSNPRAEQQNALRPRRCRNRYRRRVLEILGIQARREPDGRTSVRLPTYKDAAGLWRPAIRLPPETHAPLADAVLAFLLEEGLARRKF